MKTLLALFAGALVVELYHERTLIKKLFRLVTALAPEFPTNKPMDPTEFNTAIEQLTGAVSYLATVAELMPKVKTELDRLQAIAGGAADDKARVRELSAQLDTVNAQGAQFKGLAAMLAAAKQKADTADNEVEAELGEGLPPGTAVPPVPPVDPPPVDPVPPAGEGNPPPPVDAGTPPVSGDAPSGGGTDGGNPGETPPTLPGTGPASSDSRA